MNLFLWLIRIVAGIAIIMVIYPLDLLAIPIYYVKTGRNYLLDFRPLGFAIVRWICGCDFEWKDN